MTRTTAPQETTTPSTTNVEPGSRVRAVVQDGYGDVDVLRSTLVPRPAPKDDEVLIRVHAAGLDRGTWHLMTGTPYLLRLGFGLRRPRNPVLGRDVAGTVVATGSGVTRFRVGDVVFGIAPGSFAELAVAREDKVVAKPAGLSFEQAAVVPVSALTALKSVVDVGQVQPGQKVLVLGASGGVGSYAVQIATAHGAEVTGECSAGKRDLVLSLGARHVLDYRRDDFADGTRRYDLIVDLGGTPPLRRLRRALAPGGTVVLAGGEGTDRLTGGMGRQLRGLVWSVFLRERFAMSVPTERGSDLERLVPLLESGQVAPRIDHVYQLHEAPEAMARLTAGEVRGKVAIAVP
jgi:NADPH:quinone reductase-like Zn-dependent oxidoreductase